MNDRIRRIRPRLQILAILTAFNAFAAASPERVRVPNRPDYWKNAGFVEMEGLLRLPTDKFQTDAIRVWVKIPEGGKITATWIASQNRYTLEFPPGTIADRVETIGNWIEDVRGARIDADGNTLFHVYRNVPRGSNHQRWLEGYEWLRTNDQTDREAGELLIQLYFPEGTNQANRQEIELFRRLNHCGACHQANAPTPARMSRFERHQSDLRGFFQPLAVLGDSMTVRFHRPWDLNADDPFVTVWCGSVQTRAITRGNQRGYGCPNDEIPAGRLDIQSALKNKDAHAIRLCEARRYLYQHMDPTAQAAFQSALEDCSSGSR